MLSTLLYASDFNNQMLGRNELKCLLVKLLKNGKREFKDLRFRLSLPPHSFPHLVLALSSSWSIHSDLGAWGHMLGDVNKVVSKMLL